MHSKHLKLRNILLISLQGIGNTIMVFQAAIELASQTSCNISLLVANNGSQEIAHLLFPDNAIYTWKNKESAIQNCVYLFKLIKFKHFDEIYLAYPSGKREAIAGFLVTAKLKKVICDGDGDWKCLRKAYHSKLTKPSNIHDVDANRILLGLPYEKSKTTSQAKNTIKEIHDIDINQFLVNNDLLDSFLIGIHPGSIGNAKRWPAEKYIMLSKDLVSKFNCKFIVLGGKEENALKNEVVTGIGKNAVTCNFASLTQTAAILQRCQLFIGNDSAPMHLAAIIGTPIIALWGYTDFFRTSPYGSGNVILRMNYPCSPCYKFSGKYIDDCLHHLKCIKNIPYEGVIEVVTKYIKMLQNKSTKLSIDDFKALNLKGVEQIQLLEHGCIVVNFSEA